jgi:L-amino acid N-acyltransferase
MKDVTCSFDAHAGAILAIFNEAIVNSTALYDYAPRKPESMAPWFAAKQAGHFPVLGIEDDRGELLGFASYGSFRAWPAYKYTVEHSIYVRHDQRGRGLGERLMRAIEDEARRLRKTLLVLDTASDVAARLYARCGWTEVGAIPDFALLPRGGLCATTIFYRRL